MKKLLFIATFIFTLFCVLGTTTHLVIRSAKDKSTPDYLVISTLSKLEYYKTNIKTLVYDKCYVSSFDSYSYSSSLRYYTCEKNNIYVTINTQRNTIDYISIHTSVTLDGIISILGSPTHIRRYGSYVNFFYWKDKEVAFWSLSNNFSPNTTSYAIAYFPYKENMTDIEEYKGFKRY